jgi:hypothetical protein
MAPHLSGSRGRVQLIVRGALRRQSVRVAPAAHFGNRVGSDRAVSFGLILFRKCGVSCLSGPRDADRLALVALGFYPQLTFLTGIVRGTSRSVARFS